MDLCITFVKYCGCIYAMGEADGKTKFESGKRQVMNKLGLG